MNAAVALMSGVLPSVVHVHARIPETHPSASILGTERMGSGMVVDPDGLVLTVNYVVLGAEEVKVTLLDGRILPAEVLRHDFVSGLALIRIPEKNLRPLPLRRTADVRLGDEAFIVASVGEGGLRVANGGVSYLGPFDANWEYVLERSIMTTAMNPGLGGGPLLDHHGRVIGIVSLNMNEIGRFSLAIPADCYLDARNAFVTGRSTGGETRAWLGLFCYAVGERVVIAGVLTGGPGDRAGLKTGDVIVSVDGEDVPDRRTFYRRVWAHRPGEPVTLQIVRGKDLMTLTVASGDAEEFFA